MSKPLCERLLCRIRAGISTIAAGAMDDCTLAETALLDIAGKALEHLLDSIAEREEQREQEQAQRDYETGD